MSRTSLPSPSHNLNLSFLTTFSVTKCKLNSPLATHGSFHQSNHESLLCEITSCRRLRPPSPSSKTKLIRIWILYEFISCRKRTTTTLFFLNLISINLIFDSRLWNFSLRHDSNTSQGNKLNPSLEWVQFLVFTYGQSGASEVPEAPAEVLEAPAEVPEEPRIQRIPKIRRKMLE